MAINLKGNDTSTYANDIIVAGDVKSAQAESTVGGKRTNFKAEKLRNDADDFCKRMQESKRFLKKNELIENYKQTF